MTIVGKNLGSGLKVTASDVISLTSSSGGIESPTSCSVDVSHTRLKCSGFIGIGTSVNVLFTRTDGWTASSTVAFSAPMIYSYYCIGSAPSDIHVDSSIGCHTDGSSTLTLRGSNFGNSDSDVSVVVGGLACANPHAGHTTITCSLPIGGVTSGPVDITVTVASQVFTKERTFSYACK